MLSEAPLVAFETNIMAITSDDLKAFHDFAVAKLANRGAESLQELIDLWEMEHPLPALHQQNVAAVRAAIRDMENGDAGRPASVLLDELRAELATRSGQ
jgi:uncharacterized membrane protein